MPMTCRDHIERIAAAALVLLVVAGLAGCQGGLSTTDATARSLRAGSSRDEKASAEGEGDDESADASDEDQGYSFWYVGEGPHAKAASDPERLAALEAAKTLDREYSAGLPAPSQQDVVEPPNPWTPDPSAEDASPPVIEDVWPDKAPSAGGAKVVIRGRHLKPIQVVFGTSPARIISISDEAVAVATPAASAGAVVIVVTNGDGNYAIATTPFQYFN
jgi:hypothetical protein